MNFKKISLAFQATALFLGLAACNIKQKTINEMAFKAKRDRIVEEYPKIPHDEILQQITGNRLYSDLQESYKNSLIALKTETDYDCAKLVVAILTPQVGKYTTLGNSYGIPFIIKTCDNMGLDFYDFTPAILKKDVTEITQTPEDGSWSKEGAVFVANLLDSIIIKYDGNRSSKTLAQATKPATFGDLPPNENEVLDEKVTPYHVKANAQGLRMDHLLTFPKKKQVVLILGDSRVYCPYLDNEFIPTAILQKRHPDKEIINAGMMNYTMDDYESLYKEKARFTEPDLVIVCTDGDNILEHYFSQRNRYSRSQKIYPPTAVEEDFYHALYNNQ